MPTPYVHSGYERIKDDNYQTIDHRCIDALVNCIDISGDIVDICSPSGSGIVSRLNELGYAARGLEDAFSFDKADWIVTNPPYDRKVVDSFIDAALLALEQRRVMGAAFLMRSNFDFAMSRARLFDHHYYRGQVRMRFRPWWTEERKAQPIHNFVWHIWDRYFGTEKMLEYWPKG